MYFYPTCGAGCKTESICAQHTTRMENTIFTQAYAMIKGNISSKTGSRTELAIIANNRPCTNHYTIGQFSPIPHNTIGAKGNTLPQMTILTDNCCRMNSWLACSGNTKQCRNSRISQVGIGNNKLVT